LLTVTDVSTCTIERRFSDEFRVTAYKPATKPGLTLSMKAKTYVIAKPHLIGLLKSGGRYY